MSRLTLPYFQTSVKHSFHLFFDQSYHRAEKISCGGGRSIRPDGTHRQAGHFDRRLLRLSKRIDWPHSKPPHEERPLVSSPASIVKKEPDEKGAKSYERS
jgi:hypothetical protein